MYIPVTPAMHSDLLSEPPPFALRDHCREVHHGTDLKWSGMDPGMFRHQLNSVVKVGCLEYDSAQLLLGLRVRPSVTMTLPF
jgi:hypothetical protein